MLIMIVHFPLEEKIFTMIHRYVFLLALNFTITNGFNTKKQKELNRLILTFGVLFDFKYIFFLPEAINISYS